MSKIILVCGKICSGKTTYAKNLIKEQKAVHLSVDEISLTICGGNLGYSHAEMVDKIIKYLYEKSIEIYSCGISVVIDTGFWKKSDRDEANAFYKEHRITPQWHYIDISDEVWHERITKRNNAIINENRSDYIIDDNLMDYFISFWETPQKEEINVWINND